MGKKYIIELLDDCTSEFKGIMVLGVTQEKQICAELIPEESLRPYTEPDMEQVRKEAYERGLNDAWEAAGKIKHMTYFEKNEIFGTEFSDMVYENNTPSEALEKIRKHEQQFHVGDEFENKNGKRFVILKMDGAEIDRYIDEEGKTYCMDIKYIGMRKTGRHFPEIAEVLRKMKEE